MRDKFTSRRCTMDRGIIPINKYHELQFQYYEKDPKYKYFNRKFEIIVVEKKTLKKNYIMAEVPTHEYKRKYGESSIKIRKVFFRYVYSLIKHLYF